MFFLLASIVFARPFESYTADFTIVEKDVVVSLVLRFQDKETGSFSFQIPDDAKGLDLYIDTSAADPLVENNQLIILLKDTKEIGISYVTKQFVDKGTNFLVNLQPKEEIGKLRVQVTLPEKATLRQPIIEGDITSGSIYPKPSQALTDGRSLIFVWERTDLSKDDELSVFVQYQPSGLSTGSIVGIIAAIVGIYLIYSYVSEWKYRGLLSRPKKEKESDEKKESEKQITQEDSKEESDEKEIDHLKEDEKQIIRILKQKEGCCEQGTLRVITDFSKAHLSRLLMELEARKFIHKEKKGKRNLVFLKKH